MPCISVPLSSFRAGQHGEPPGVVWCADGRVGGTCAVYWLLPPPPIQPLEDALQHSLHLYWCPFSRLGKGRPLGSW